MTAKVSADPWPDTPRQGSGNRPTKAVFLDRDGVLNRRAAEHDYIRVFEDFNIYPNVPESISRLSASGFLVFVVTNQRGIARKLVDQAEVDRMHRHLEDLVGATGGRIEKFYLCPHDLVEACECRKPNPGMLLEAQRDYQLNLEKSWMIGDSDSDVLAGKRAGCRTVRIGEKGLKEDVEADFCVTSLRDAVDLIGSENSSRQSGTRSR